MSPGTCSPAARSWHLALLCLIVPLALFAAQCPACCALHTFIHCVTCTPEDKLSEDRDFGPFVCSITRGLIIRWPSRWQMPHTCWVDGWMNRLLICFGWIYYFYSSLFSPVLQIESRGSHLRGKCAESRTQTSSFYFAFEIGSPWLCPGWPPTHDPLSSISPVAGITGVPGC
jgi:hypothetical protein